MTAQIMPGAQPAADAQEPGQVRRIVTGHDAAGKSVVLHDGPAPNIFRSATVLGLGSAAAWSTPSGGAHNDGDEDAAGPDAQISMSPEPGGTIFRVADFPPDSEYLSDHDADSMFAEIGGPDARVNDGGNRHFWAHRTDSLDYAVVIDGEIWMIMDEGETLVRAGDVIVQRGTSHAWSNRSDSRCRIAFVLVGTPAVGDSPGDAPEQ